MTVSCPECLTKITLTAAMSATKIKCPECDSIIPVGGEPEPEPVDSPSTEPESQVEPPPVALSESATNDLPYTIETEPNQQPAFDFVIENNEPAILEPEIVEPAKPTRDDYPVAQPKPDPDDDEDDLDEEKPAAPAPSRKAGSKSAQGKAPKVMDWSEQPPPMPGQGPSASSAAGQPKVLDWNEQPAEQPKPPPPKSEVAQEDEADDDLVLPSGRTGRRRKSASPLRVLVFSGVVLGIVASIATVIVVSIVYTQRSESTLAEEAFEMYDEGQYVGAKSAFAKLKDDYPESADYQRYRIYGELAEMKSQLAALVDKQSVVAGLQALLDLVNDPKAKFHLERNEKDVESVVVVVNDAVAYLVDQQDKGLAVEKKSDTLSLEFFDESESTLSVVKEQLYDYERALDLEPKLLEKSMERVESSSQSAAASRLRVENLIAVEQELKSPTMRKLDDVIAVLQEQNLTEDPIAQRLLTAARQEMVDNIQSQSVAVAAERLANRPDSLISLVSNSDRLLTTGDKPASGYEPVQYVVVNGTLYVFHAGSRQVLWQERIGPVDDPKAIPEPIPYATPIGEQRLVVCTYRNQSRAISCRDAYTGRVLWHQNVTNEVIGTPIVYGDTIHLGIFDEFGSILSFNISDGKQYSVVQLGQPIATGLSLSYADESSGLAYVAATGLERYVYLFQLADRGPKKAAGMRLQRVLETGHTSYGLTLTPTWLPVLSNTNQHALIAATRSGPAEGILQLFVLPAIQANAKPALSSTMSPSQTIELSGMIESSPVIAGSTLYLSTSRVPILIFGIDTSQGGYNLYKLAEHTTGEDESPISTSMPLWATDSLGAYLADGRLLLTKPTFTAKTGYGINFSPQSSTIGNLIGNPTFDRAKQLALLPTAITNGLVRINIVDMNNSTVVSRVNLDSHITDIVQAGEGIYLISSQGGIYSVNGTNQDAFQNISGLAMPRDKPVGKQSVAQLGDVIAVLRNQINDESKTHLTIISNGQTLVDNDIDLPAGPAGPIAMIDSGDIVVPLQNGRLAKISAETSSVTTGPAWRSAKGAGGGRVELVSLGQNRLLVADGERTIQLIEWESDADAKKLANWNLDDKLASQLIPIKDEAGQDQLAVMDQSAMVYLIELARSDEFVGNWALTDRRLSTDLSDHLTSAGNDYAILTSTDGLTLAKYSLLDREKLWSIKSADQADSILGWKIRGQSVYVTMQTGRIFAYDIANGDLLDVSDAVADRFPTSAAVPISGNRLLMPLNDGTVEIIRMNNLPND